MYSQNNEEEIILDAVRDISMGVFLDIGAYDGEKFSNTRQLAKAGWGGVLVEPAPKPFMKLLELYRDREDVSLVNAAIALDRRLVTFWYSEDDGLSTTEREHVEAWKEHATFMPFYLQTMRLSDLLARFPMPFEVVSIDTERTSVDLFNAFPFDLVHPHVIVVEHDQRQVEVATRGSQFGYHAAHVNGENVILAR